MNKEKRNDNISVCNKLINKFILNGKRFVQNSCVLGSSAEDDYQYFVFTKSTKALISIRELLRKGNTEDSLILLRSMFEGYLAGRYLFEKSDEKSIRDFMVIPNLIAKRAVIRVDGKEVYRESKEPIDFEQKQPSQMKLGKDKSYFYDLYEYFCNYAHCNFSTLAYYLDNKKQFTCEKETNALLTRVLVIFVYSKIFENIVTVEGEDFLNSRIEQQCYQLLKESTLFLYSILDYFSKYDANTNEELNKHMRKLFKNMRNSLKEEVGSLDKSFIP